MYYGLATSHELRTAFMYESDYASRESVYRNIDRATKEVMSQPVTIGWDDLNAIPPAHTRAWKSVCS